VSDAQDARRWTLTTASYRDRHLFDETGLDMKEYVKIGFFGTGKVMTIDADADRA